MADGIIFVGAAGNGRWYHDVPGGLDWDNTFEMGRRYPDSTVFPYYYHRGSSPTANDVDMPNISVGSIYMSSDDEKANYSDCGPGVDIWAPGTSIISALKPGFGVTLVPDERNSDYSLGKISGTSMASPQVCGILACALEIYPDMTQIQAKEYITKIAKMDQVHAYKNSGGYADTSDINGAPNLFLYYKREREISGNSFPKTTYQVRPATGSVYPRQRIRLRK
jgi:hypothetical protein